MTSLVRPKTEIGRRIAAAMVLAGVNQAELGQLMQGDGLRLRDPEEISQGRKQPQRVHYESMARHLGVPVEWFTEPLPGLIRASTGDAWEQSVLDGAALAAALAELAEVQQQLQRVQELLRRGEQPEGSTGND